MNEFRLNPTNFDLDSLKPYSIFPLRTYRDRKDLALQAAQFLKSRNPNSVIKLKDLKSGAEIVTCRGAINSRKGSSRQMPLP